MIYLTQPKILKQLFADRKIDQLDSENMFLCVINNNFKANNFEFVI